MNVATCATSQVTVGECVCVICEHGKEAGSVPSKCVKVLAPDVIVHTALFEGSTNILLGNWYIYIHSSCITARSYNYSLV